MSALSWPRRTVVATIFLVTLYSSNGFGQRPELILTGNTDIGGHEAESTLSAAPRFPTRLICRQTLHVEHVLNPLSDEVACIDQDSGVSSL